MIFIIYEQNFFHHIEATLVKTKPRLLDFWMKYGIEIA